jgi:hypothetical protein
VCTNAASRARDGAWQQLTWAKEILQILDRPEHHTGSKTALEHMMASRAVLAPNGNEIGFNLLAIRILMAALLLSRSFPASSA